MSTETPVELRGGLRRRICIAGFTLLELLVVVAVIAILASLLLPVLGRAKTKAQGIFCMNNTRQLALAWIMYADDHNGQLVPNPQIWVSPPADTSMAYTTITWIAGIMGGNGPDDTNTLFLQNSLLASYLGR